MSAIHLVQILVGAWSLLNISWLTLILKADWKEDRLQISIYRIWPSYGGAEYLQLRFKWCCIVIVSSIFSRQMLLGSFYVFVIIILSIRVTMMEIFILTKLLICRHKRNAYCVENLRFFFKSLTFCELVILLLNARENCLDSE